MGCSYLALHLACDANVLLQIIQYLVQNGPRALKSKGLHGFPLHHACHSSADLSTINFLIQAWPDALKTPNQSAALPLHEACHYCGKHANVSAWLTYCRALSLVAASNQPSSLLPLSNNADSQPLPPPVMLLKTLVQAFPDAVCIDDEEGYLPLHNLCCNEAALQIEVQLLVEAWPEALQAAALGRLPLHLACQHGSPVNVIQYLTHSSPFATKVQNYLGQLPLHVACSNKLDFAVIESLIQAWPYSVLVPWDYIKNDVAGSVVLKLVSLWSTAMKRVEFEWKTMTKMTVMKCPKTMMKKTAMKASTSSTYKTKKMTRKRKMMKKAMVMASMPSIGMSDQEVDVTRKTMTIAQATETPRWKQMILGLMLDLVCNNSTSQQPLTMELALLLTKGTPPLHFACLQPCTCWFLHWKQMLEQFAALSTFEDWRHFDQGTLPLHCACQWQAKHNMVLWQNGNILTLSVHAPPIPWTLLCIVICHHP